MKTNVEVSQYLRDTKLINSQSPDQKFWEKLISNAELRRLKLALDYSNLEFSA